MTQDEIVSIGTHAIWVSVQLSAPILIVSLVVGLMVSVFQAVTQLQESTLTFIPKILAVVVVVVLAGPWMMNTFVDYTRGVFRGIERVGANTHSAP